MMEHMRDLMRKEVLGAKVEKTEYVADTEMIIPEWLR